MGFTGYHDYSWIDTGVVASTGDSWFASYKNDTGQGIFIYSISMLCGTGSGYFYDSSSGGSASGSGQPITVGVISSNNVSSNRVTISNVCGTSAYNGGVTSTVRTTGQRYTFTFSSGVPVGNGDTVLFYFNNPSPSSGAVLCVYATGVTTVSTTPPVTNYTLSYNANGGSGAPASQTLRNGSGTVSNTRPTRSITVNCGANGSKFGNGQTVYNNWASRSMSFLGWSTSRTATSPTYGAGQSITIRANTTLYAVWGNATYGTLPSLGTGSRDLIDLSPDEEFQCWSETTDADDKITTSSNITKSRISNNSITIHAIWSQPLVLDANGGVFYQDDSPQPGTETYKVFDYDPSEGHSLNYPVMSLQGDQNGWARTPTGSKVYDLTDTYQESTGAHLYACWTQGNYSVTFRTGWGNNEVIKEIDGIGYGQSLTEDQVPNVRSGPYKKPGPFRFQGWSGSYEDITEDRVLTAMWEFSPVWICEYDKNNQKVWKPYTPKE